MNFFLMLLLLSLLLTFCIGVGCRRRIDVVRVQLHYAKAGLSRGVADDNGRTEDRTMAARSSVTWTHCSVR
jgi:hypothetical protein